MGDVEMKMPSTDTLEFIFYSFVTLALCGALILLGVPWIPIAFLLLILVLLGTFNIFAKSQKEKGGPKE